MEESEQGLFVMVNDCAFKGTATSATRAVLDPNQVCGISPGTRFLAILQRAEVRSTVVLDASCRKERCSSR